jgi:hypothetical protein
MTDKLSGIKRVFSGNKYEEVYKLVTRPLSTRESAFLL